MEVSGERRLRVGPDVPSGEEGCWEYEFAYRVGASHVLRKWASRLELHSYSSHLPGLRRSLFDRFKVRDAFELSKLEEKWSKALRDDSKRDAVASL